MAFHPVDVALQRVDLAVMGQHAERLGQPPLREGVGGIALVIDREGGFKPLVHQIGVEHRHLFGQHHALVDDAAAGQRTQVKPLNLRGNRRLFDPAADDVQLALEGFLVNRLVAADQNLLDFGAGRVGLVTQHFDVHRHMPPAIDVMAHPQHFGFHDCAAPFLRAEIGTRQKDLAHGDQLLHVRFMPGAADLVVEKADRNLHVNARAIAGLAIGIDSPPVPDRLQRIDAVLHHLSAGPARDRHHQTYTAGRMFIIAFIKRMFVHKGALRFFGGNPGVIIGHGASPATY